MSHQHCCGHTDLRALLFSESPPGDAGCGFVWEHPDPPAPQEYDDWAKSHTCPRCGKQPWSLKYFGARTDEFGHNRAEHIRLGDIAWAAKEAALKQAQES